MWIAGLFIALLCIQLFVDAIFAFICYTTGVIILRAIKLFSSKYQYLSYKEFREQYKNKSRLLTPLGIGIIVWVVPLLIVCIYNELR